MAKQTKPEALMPAKNAFIYQFRSIVRAGRASLNDWDQALISSLPRLGLSDFPHSFAAVLLDLLGPHPDFKSASRVCLIRRLGQSNNIQVIASQNRSDRIHNSMEAGYSCFVSPHGSMFNLSPGTLRIYGNARDVIKTYEKDNKPPQRSIARIVDMGLGGGYFLPSFDRDESLIGGLFINFDDESAVNLSHAQCTVLSLIEAYARSAITATRSAIFERKLSSDGYWQGRRFATETLADCLKDLQSRAALQLDNHAPSFLVSHGNLACLLHHLAEEAVAAQLRISIRQTQEGISFTCAGLADLKHKPEILQGAARSWTLTLTWRQSLLEFTLPYEPAVDDLGYSVEVEVNKTAAAPPKARHPSTPASAKLDEDGLQNIRASLSAKASARSLTLISVGYLQAEWNDDLGQSIKQQMLADAQKLAVTGLIIIHSGIILQILEGSSDKLAGFLTTLNERHQFGPIRSLFLDEISQRQFNTIHFLSSEDDINVSSHQFVSEILALNNLRHPDAAKQWMKMVKKYLEATV